VQLRTLRAIDSYLGRVAIACLRPLAIALGVLLRRDHRLAMAGEVVWIKMLGGGSLLLAMPMLLGFRNANPQLRMVLITTPDVKPFAELMGVFDEYRVIDVRGVRAIAMSAVRVLGQTLRADCIVDLEVHSRLTTVFATVTMARNRVSFWQEDIYWRRGIATHLIFFNRSSGSYYFYDRVAELLGSPVADRAACRAALSRACEVNPSGRPHAQVCVGFACSDLGRERMLTPVQWVRVFRDNLRSDHRTFIFLGGPADLESGEAIITELRRAFPELTFDNRCGKTPLRRSVGVLFDSREFWGIDSGLLHVSRIAGLSCLSYWGPTDPSTRLRLGWQLDEKVVYRKIACSPCVHTSEEPPCRGDNRCIQGLFDPERAPLGWTPIDHPGHGS
jgi:ADP-heptose:LPS heptosyltransferase